MATFSSHTVAERAISMSVWARAKRGEIHNYLIRNPQSLLGNKINSERINPEGTEEGVVELLNGEAEARLGEAAV